MSVYRVKPRVVSEIVDGHALLIDENSSELITLNTVGSHVWAALTAGASTIAECVEALAREFPDEPRETLHADVADFLEELIGVGVITQSA